MNFLEPGQTHTKEVKKGSLHTPYKCISHVHIFACGRTRSLQLDVGSLDRTRSLYLGVGSLGRARTFWESSWAILLVFMVIGLFNSMFLVLRAAYFHVLGNQRCQPFTPRNPTMGLATRAVPTLQGWRCWGGGCKAKWDYAPLLASD